MSQPPQDPYEQQPDWQPREPYQQKPGWQDPYQQKPSWPPQEPYQQKPGWQDPYEQQPGQPPQEPYQQKPGWQDQYQQQHGWPPQEPYQQKPGWQDPYQQPHSVPGGQLPYPGPPQGHRTPRRRKRHLVRNILAGVGGLIVVSAVVMPSRANGQPAFGIYLRDPHGEFWHAFGLLVITTRGDRVSAITRFDNAVIGPFGFPRRLAD